jgi:hypothetical protein
MKCIITQRTLVMNYFPHYGSKSLATNRTTLLKSFVRGRVENYKFTFGKHYGMGGEKSQDSLMFKATPFSSPPRLAFKPELRPQPAAHKRLSAHVPRRCRRCPRTRCRRMSGQGPWLSRPSTHP